ncbi:hypothetical protein GSI_08566 [Ganoderma sinense ZZ0214-1]|uniref:Uncharacterized protein n=1 Tax=Ganoderma sinense ZZ0214-1 TaxID=1077348 RepID=A0A2G8S4N2_9APHY|nr:hypothetical protein GSI_08566 [Ganoderma sinense ZZ0214-1]
MDGHRVLVLICYRESIRDKWMLIVHRRHSNDRTCNTGCKPDHDAYSGSVNYLFVRPSQYPHGNSGGHRSSSLASQQFPPVPSSSAGAIVDVSATGPLALSSSATVTVSLPLSSSTSPPPSSPHRVDIGTIVAIALSALAVLLASALALFFLCRRGRRPRSRTESRRTSVGSSQRRLEPYVYRGRSSRRLSSVWTGFGSVSVDPDFDPRPEPWRRSESGSLGFPFAEKPEPDQIHRGSAIACAPGASSSSYASRCPSPASAEARPLVRDPSVLSLHEGVAARYLGIGIHIQPLSALHASSTSPELPVLSGADYATANPANWSGGNSGWRES